jgi:hypothetical protein
MNKKSKIAIASLFVVFAAALYAGILGSTRVALPIPTVTSVPNGKPVTPAGSFNNAAITKYLPQRLVASKPVEERLKPKANVSTPGQLVIEVQDAAKDGSPSAMYWMGLGLQRCIHVDMSSNADIEEKVAKLLPTAPLTIFFRTCVRPIQTISN